MPDGYIATEFELSEEDYDYLIETNCDDPRDKLGYIGMDQFGSIKIRQKQRIRWANYNWNKTVPANVTIYEKFVDLMEEDIKLQRIEQER